MGLLRPDQPGGTVRFGGDDTASGRTYLHELARLKDGREGQNYGVYHDQYRRTADGWRFAERVYEVRYFDASPLGGVSVAAGAVAAQQFSS
ncbi:nuclear transport factor 2 family protein [Flexivirga alba]|uniref:Nuclear transport factor 2 family protein n=1 Tax=Flexivirga alba TaxID=702742 RepID=A0ABW2AFM4_9MICO